MNIRIELISAEVVKLYLEVLRTLTRIITGRLLTDEQIQNISERVVGTYFEDWFAPKRQLEAELRVQEARKHISEASRIISSLQGDLEAQAQQLDELSKEIEEKKELANRYAVLAKTNQEAFSAFKAEMEEAVRKELVAQAEKGKRTRRFVTFTIWLITLILGATLGAYLEISFESIFQRNQPKSDTPSQPVSTPRPSAIPFR